MVCVWEQRHFGLQKHLFCVSLSNISVTFCQSGCFHPKQHTLLFLACVKTAVLDCNHACSCQESFGEVRQWRFGAFFWMYNSFCVLQEGYWELTTELGEFINVNVDLFANVFLQSKGILSLGENSQTLFQSFQLHHFISFWTNSRSLTLSLHWQK